MLCNVTGALYLPNGQLGKSLTLRFKRVDQRVTAEYLGAVVPNDVYTQSDKSGQVDFEILTGVYMMHVEGGYSVRAVVPDAATADIADCIDAAAIPDQPPVWYQQALNARDEAVDAADRAEDAASQAAGAVVADYFVATDAERLALSPSEGETAYVSQTGHTWKWQSGAWVDMGAAPFVLQSDLAAETARAQVQERLARWRLANGQLEEIITIEPVGGSSYSIGWTGLTVLTGDGAARAIDDRAASLLTSNRALYIDTTQTFAGAYVVTEAALNNTLQASFVTGTNFLLFMNRNGRASGPLAEAAAAWVAVADETARAIAAEQQAVDIASRPVHGQMLHRSPDDPRAIGFDSIGGSVIPYDRRGYAKIGLDSMLHRDVGESTTLRIVDSAGNSVAIDGTGGTAADHPSCEVVFSADAIDINIRQYGSVYVQWRVRHLTLPSRVADVWRIYGVFEAFRNGPGDYSAWQELFNVGEVEMAIAIQGKAELIGGTTHGGEMQDDFFVLLDGARIDHTVAGVRECRRIEMFQRADMFEPGPSGGPNWPDDPPVLAATKARHWRFDRDGLTLGNHVEWAQAGFAILHSYFGMSPMRRANGSTQITDTTARAPIWEPVDVTAAGGPDVFSQDDHVKVWGDRYALDTSATRGWDRPTRNVRVWNAEAYNKVYFDYHGGEGATVGDTTEVGMTWDVETRIDVSIKED